MRMDYMMKYGRVLLLLAACFDFGCTGGHNNRKAFGRGSMQRITVPEAKKSGKRKIKSVGKK